MTEEAETYALLTDEALAERLSKTSSVKAFLQLTIEARLRDVLQLVGEDDPAVREALESYKQAIEALFAHELVLATRSDVLIDVDVEQGSIVEVEIVPMDDAVLRIRLAGEMDLSNVERVEIQVAPALSHEPKQLIVDADRLTFADSAAIALWLRWSSTVERFEIRGLSPLLRRVLQAMGLEERLLEGR